MLPPEDSPTAAAPGEVGWLPDLTPSGRHGTADATAHGRRPQVEPEPAPVGVLAALRRRLPPAVRGGRVALTGRATRSLALVAVLAVAFAGVTTWRAHAVVQSARTAQAAGGSVDGTDGPAQGGTPSTAPPAAPSAAASSAVSIVVDVAGRVAHPGVLALPAGARVVDALRRAGGALPGVDTSALDLARVLADGEQVLVGVPGAGVTGGPTTTPTRGGPRSSPAGPSEPVSLNRATADELDALPGVGPVLAQRIVTWREAHGGFSSVGQLQEIPGLGGKKFATLQPLVRL